MRPLAWSFEPADDLEEETEDEPIRARDAGENESPPGHEEAPGIGEGIPEPELIDASGAPWRSRLLDGRWQVNAGHRDYRLLQGRPVLKLRYLALLFAKEVVLRSSQDPRFEEPLEQVIEVVAYADRNLGPRGRRASRGGDDPKS